MTTAEPRVDLTEYRKRPSQKALEQLFDHCVLHGIPCARMLDDFYDEARSSSGGVLAQQRLAQVLIEAGRPVEALSYIDDCLRAWKDSPRLVWLAGMASIYAGSFAKAQECVVSYSKVGRYDHRLVLEAAFALRFGMPARWRELGEALLELCLHHRQTMTLVVQIAVRENDSALAVKIASQKSLRPVSLSRRQETRFEKLVRVQFLQLLRRRSI